MQDNPRYQRAIHASADLESLGHHCPRLSYESHGRNAVTRDSMRLTTWNCQMGRDVDHYLAELAPLRADIVTLQECRRPRHKSGSVLWRGTYTHQGVAVVSTRTELQLEPVNVPSLHSTVVPVVVHATQPFVFVGVWTHPPYDKVAWAAMSACVQAAAGRPVVAAGDFNVSPGVQGQQRSALQFLKRMRDKHGLVSAYHQLYRETPGTETRATHYYQKKESKPFHIDYCFVPEGWVGRLAGVDIGTFRDWPQSDHRPVTVELKD